MKLPCAKQIPFVVYGLSFLQPAMTNIQYQNLALIATALILGSKFNLTEISLMWLKQKSVSALSEFLSDAKFSTAEMHHLFLLRTMHLYKITKGYFIVDDTMLHHSKFCKWIPGVSFLFDHAIGATLKAGCIVFLYFNDGKYTLANSVTPMCANSSPHSIIAHKNISGLPIAVNLAEWRKL